MSFHKPGAQKRKEKKKREENERRGMQTLFEVGIKKTQADNQTIANANSEEEKSEGGSHEQYSLCETEIETNKDTNLETCTNIMDKGPDINTGPGPSTPSKHVDTKHQAHCSADISQSSSESITVVPDNIENNSRPSGSVKLDIGYLNAEIPSMSDIEKYVISGHIDFPLTLPQDSNKQKFPEGILKFRNINSELHIRDWLVWSEHKKSLYCFPCRLFCNSVSKLSTSLKSSLATPEGWPASAKWRKLCDRVPVHEKSNGHKECYLAWRELERRLSRKKGIDNLIEATIKTESEKWYNILKRILDVTIFLGERGLAFQGSSVRIGDSNNGNFLGLIELLSHWDPILKEHVLKVEESQKKGERLQVHYLSIESQNEFIAECSDLVKQHVLRERQNAKYYAIIVDSTPDSSHIEQTTFLLRYLVRHESYYEIVERFLKFEDCSDKNGSDIAQLITETLESHAIPLDDCRAQGYDNASNMSGKYNGAQAIIKEQCPTAIFSPCGCHTLNLCGNDAAECIPEAITYFGTIQTIYTLFSCSPKRWEILSKRIGCSLHRLSSTRWSDRVESVKPFAAHLPGVKLALEDLLELNLTPKTRNEIHGAIRYVGSFTCIIMSVVWHSILVPIDICNKVIQASDATLDMEVANIESLIKQLMALRNSWKAMWNEAKLVAYNLQIDIKLSRDGSKLARKKTRFYDDDIVSENVNELNETDESSEEAHFRKHIFYVVLDNVVGGLTVRFNSAKIISDTFSFLWKYGNISKDELKCKAANLAEKYSKDIICEDFVQEVIHLKMVHNANFGVKQLSAMELLNALANYKLESIFPNVIVSLRIFLTAPATVASAERSFSKLKFIKNYLRSTMSQDRLNNLARLSIESDIARQINYDTVIRSFANKKTRKVALF